MTALSPATPTAPAATHGIPTAAEIDASCAPMLRVFLLSAGGWLCIGSLLAMLAAIKLHTPDFFADQSWLTFGRVRPAHLVTMIYGWGSLAGIGVLLWFQARLCGTRLPLGDLLAAACFTWNAAILIGTGAILTGAARGVEWLELPALWSLPLAGVLLLVAFVSLLMLGRRRVRGLYVTQWYALSALLWFPLLLLIANGLLEGGGIHGVGLAAVNWWYTHNVLCLWLTPIGLAAAYYLIPLILDVPLHSEALSLFGFWTLILVYAAAGMHHLIGGPMPAWLISVGVVSSVLLLIPVAAIALNLHLTMRGHFARLRDSLPLRFVVFGAMSYALVGVQGALQSLRSVNGLTHFTHYTVAHAHLGVYAFITMTLFGTAYYILPRISGRDVAPLVMRVHFWCSGIGVALYWLGLTAGGLHQGVLLQDAKVPFIEAVVVTIPYLGLRSAAGYLMLIGHGCFIWLLLRHLLARTDVMNGGRT